MNKQLCSPTLDVMNFLNEVIETYPDAISFASGRPSSEFLDLRRLMLELDVNTVKPGSAQDDELEIGSATLTQYGKTGGLFNYHISQYLKNDENFNINENDIVITNGCQEALALCVDTLFNPNDILVTLDPTYIGIVGVCRIRGIEIKSIHSDAETPILLALENGLMEVKSSGKNVRAIYLIPDFSNPMGESIPLDQRIELIEFCANHNISIFEDSAYRCFRYAGETPAAMAQLDRKGVVFHIGSFSKSICPGLRIGYIACSEKHGHHPSHVQELCRVKSFTTLNTPPLTQAIVASILVKNHHSLRDFVEPALQAYKGKRDRLLESLNEQFNQEYREENGLNWSVPDGGFFLTIDVPFIFDMNEVLVCAKEFGIICVPVSLFSLQGRHKNTIRLSFSYARLDEIHEGCIRLSRYIKSKLNREEGNVRSTPE
jgi:(S)-3,5-dihydroxyphenylglycine transaminase